MAPGSNLPQVNVDVVLGSRNDLEQVQAGIEFLISATAGKVRLHIISCHRNPQALRDYAKYLEGVDVVIAAAGKAAALPGVLKAWLVHFGKTKIPVIGVALAGETPDACEAAIVSIEQIPGQPVELDEKGQAYSGPGGMLAACKAAVTKKFPERVIVDKPPELDISLPWW